MTALDLLGRQDAAAGCRHSPAAFFPEPPPAAVPLSGCCGAATRPIVAWQIDYAARPPVAALRARGRLCLACRCVAEEAVG